MLILFDCHCVLHRNMHKVMKESKNNKIIIPTLIQKFLWEVLTITEQFASSDVTVCFIWDSNKSINKRKKVFPDYKLKKPREVTIEEELQFRECYKTFKIIRTQILPGIGFANSFIQTGLEADDIIAKIVDDYCKDEDILFIANDEDMYQVLRLYVEMYNPTKRLLSTYKTFMDEYGIPPTQWARVKAMAGCSSDNVKGIQGVGEKTALKYLKKKLKKTSAGFQKITSKEGEAIIKKTLPVVQLPHALTKPVDIAKNYLNIEDFRDICDRYDLHSFQNQKNLDRWHRVMR